MSVRGNHGVMACICIVLFCQTLVSLGRRGAFRTSSSNATAQNQNQAGPGTIRPTLPSPNFCFVHVGKTGGNSIHSAIVQLIQYGIIGGAVQIHGENSRPSLDIDFAWKASLREYVAGRKGKVGIFDGQPTTVKQYRNLGGPLSNETSNAFPICAQTGNVFYWIRDPVSRFISVWNFLIPKHPMLSNYSAGELNTLIENLAAEENESPSRGYQHFWEIFYDVPHVMWDISFYFGDKQSLSTNWEERSKSCKSVLDSLPIVFVGRSEYMSNDWDAFIQLLPHGADQVKLPHTHSTSQSQTKLSKESIDFLRKFYASDYDCISHMVKKGLVEKKYLEYITSNEREYIF